MILEPYVDAMIVRHILPRRGTALREVTKKTKGILEFESVKPSPSFSHSEDRVHCSIFGLCQQQRNAQGERAREWYTESTMTYDEVQKSLDQALTLYSAKMEEIRKEHADAIQKILAEAKAHRIAEIKKSLQ